MSVGESSDDDDDDERMMTMTTTTTTADESAARPVALTLIAAHKPCARTQTLTFLRSARTRARSSEITKREQRAVADELAQFEVERCERRVVLKRFQSSPKRQYADTHARARIRSPTRK